MRTVTQSATDPTREIAAYSNGQGSYMTGERDRGTGGGTFSTISGPGSAGMSTEQWGALPNEEKIARNVAAIRQSTAAMQHLNQARQPQTRQVWSAPRTPQRGTDWGGALTEYLNGDVGTDGYRMMKNLLGNPTGQVRTPSGKTVTVMTPAGKLAEKLVPTLIGQDMENQGYSDAMSIKAGAGGTGPDFGDMLDRERFLLDKDKFAYQQDQDELTNSRESMAQRLKEREATQAIYDKYAQEFMAPKGAPASMRETLWQMADAQGVSPTAVIAAVNDMADGKKIQWDDPKKYDNFIAGVMEKAGGPR